MEGKKAMLVVSFGTTHNDTREKTITACENRLKKEFPEYDFFRAWTSGMIIKKIKKRDNEEILFPAEALDEIYRKGYEEVIIQSLHLICGEEYEKLMDIVDSVKDRFRKVAVGRPLLYSVEDYGYAADFMENTVAGDIEGEEVKAATLWMGHGTYHRIHPAYAALDYRMRSRDIKSYVGTVESYPGLEEAVFFMKKDGIEKVHLRPFLLVAGDHAKNDMAGEDEDSWVNILRKKGFDVEVHLEGIGESEMIQDKFVHNLREAVEKTGRDAFE